MIWILPLILSFQISFRSPNIDNIPYDWYIGYGIAHKNFQIKEFKERERGKYYEGEEIGFWVGEKALRLQGNHFRKTAQNINIQSLILSFTIIGYEINWIAFKNPTNMLRIGFDKRSDYGRLYLTYSTNFKDRKIKNFGFEFIFNIDNLGLNWDFGYKSILDNENFQKYWQILFGLNYKIGEV